MTPPARRWLLLVATLAAAGLTARLGVWQLSRAEQKLMLQQTLQSRRALPPIAPQDLARSADAASAQHYRRIDLAGNWLPAQTVYLENRQMNARPGFFALTPLLLADGTAVVVQRGWLPRDMADRTHISVVPPLAGPVQVHGHIAPAPSRLYDVAGAAAGPIRQNLALDAFAQETGLTLRPLTIVQDDGPTPVSDGLLRQWHMPAVDVQKHYGYAFQWFAISALILGLYAWFQLIRPRRHAAAAPDADHPT